MQLILIRHGEPDYEPVTQRGFIGHGRSLAPLSERGAEQARRCAQSELLRGAELILASPLTRALQTAAIISRSTGIPLTVEVDLREWEPDRSYRFASEAEVAALSRDYAACRGVQPAGEPKRWEPTADIVARVDPVMQKYNRQGLSRVIVVTHGEVIRRFTGQSRVECCKPCAVEYREGYPYFGWVE